jgi:hypothetical protein
MADSARIADQRADIDTHPPRWRRQDSLDDAHVKLPAVAGSDVIPPNR